MYLKLLCAGLFSLGSLFTLAQPLPIKPSRTISFNTEEGSNMDVDVSANGRTIVFDLLGDLYTIPVTGGYATQLTRGLAINLRPVWSPDGDKIAFVSDYSGSLHLNIKDLKQKLHSVLGRLDASLEYDEYHKPSPLWSPDGNYISVGDSMYCITGGKRPLQFRISNLIRFSRDGALLYYLDSNRIYSFDKALGAKTLLSSELKQFQAGVLAPNCRWWIYVTDSAGDRVLIAKNLESNAERILVPSLLVKYPHYRASAWTSSFTCSEDSRFVFIGYGGCIHRIDLQTSENLIIPFRARVNVDLGRLNYNRYRVREDSVNIKYCRYGNTTPDGKHLVFSALSRIYIMDIPGGKPRCLCSQPLGQFQPVISPDGKWVAYVSSCDTSGGSVWRVSVNGGKPEKLMDSIGQYQRLAWSPDGSVLAVVRGSSKLQGLNYDLIGRLYLIDVNQKIVKMIVDSVPLRNQLAFSKDGKQIIYAPNNDTYMENTQPFLVSRNISDGIVTNIAVGWKSVLPAFIEQRSISPNGRYMVYSLGEDLYLLPVCPFESGTVMYDERQSLNAIRFGAGVDPVWADDGNALHWTYGNHFYSIKPENIIRAAISKAQKAITNCNFIEVAVKPDQDIPISIKVAGFHSHGTLALTEVKIITMKMNQVIDKGTIIVKDGRITALGPVGLIAIPKEARILHLPGTTVIPGLIDVHLHTRMPSDIFPQQSWTFLTDLAYGVTTMRDPSYSYESFGYTDLLSSGLMVGPRLYSVGRAVILHDFGITKIDNFSDARAIVEKRSRLGAICVKQYQLPTRLQRQWLLLASESAGLNMTNEGAQETLFSIAMMKDGGSGVEHNPNWGDTYSDVINFVARSGSYLTPTLQVRYSDKLAGELNDYKYWNKPDQKMLHFFPALAAAKNGRNVDTVGEGYNCPSEIDANIYLAGGRIALGSHGNEQGTGVHNELWAIQMGGLSNLQALEVATIVGAEALGIQKDVGSIEVNKIADLLILNKDPLLDIHNSREIRYVMRSGVLYDANTLNTIWPTATSALVGIGMGNRTDTDEP